MSFYRIWGAVRQTAVRAGLLCEGALFKLTGGKAPRSYFIGRSGAGYIGTNVRLVSENDCSFTIAKYTPDGKIDGGDFVIASSTDFHFDRDDDLNAKTVELFIRQITETKPDFVVLTGDIILGKYQQFEAIEFAKMMEKLGVYWTAVFGNHETREERGFYKWLLLHSFSRYPHCLVKHGPDSLFGYGNFTVNILGCDGRVRETLFMFDSGRNVSDKNKKEYGLPADSGSYDFLKKEQIEFYKNETDRLNRENGKVDSIMYMHIPLPEYALAFKENEAGEYVPSGECEIIYGSQYESVGCAEFNSGMFDAVLEKGSTKAVFAGHDHVNDWCALYKGVYLVYSLHAGYNKYHLGDKCGKPESEWVQGITVTTVHSDGTLEIRPSYNRKYLNGGKSNE